MRYASGMPPFSAKSFSFRPFSLASLTADSTSFFIRVMGLKFVLRETRSAAGITPFLPSVRPAKRSLCAGLRSTTAGGGGGLLVGSRTGLEPVLGLELGTNVCEVGFGVKLALGFHRIEALVGLCIPLDVEAGPAGGMRGS